MDDRYTHIIIIKNNSTNIHNFKLYFTLFTEGIVRLAKTKTIIKQLHMNFSTNVSNITVKNNNIKSL